MSTKKSVRPIPASQPSGSVATPADRLPGAVSQTLNDLTTSTLPKLALLARWSSAEASNEFEDTNERLEVLAWRGMELLCHEIVRDLEMVLRAGGLQDSGFAMLSDDDGGVE